MKLHAELVVYQGILGLKRRASFEDLRRKLTERQPAVVVEV